MRNAFGCLVLLTVAVCGIQPVVAGAAAGPELEVEERGDLTVLSVGGHRLRVTGAPVTGGAVGADPTGRAWFAAWTEGLSDRWFSYSRDGGTTWSEAGMLQTGLTLRDGLTRPGEPLPTVKDGLFLPADGNVFLVQFTIISLPEFRQAIELAGGEVLQHFPHNAHLVRMSPSVLTAVSALDFVERIDPYHPSYRLEPELRDWLADPEGVDRMRLNVMAYEWGPAGKNRIRDAAVALGAAVAENWPEGHIIELWVTRAQLRALAGHDDVLWIDRWSAPEHDMDLVRQDGGADWLEANTGPPGFCGQGVRGEVYDSGCRTTHQDFDDILLHGNNNQGDHGTKVYGVVFGNGDRDGDGNAQATGNLPCAQGICADNGYSVNRFNHTAQLKASPYFAVFQTNSWGSSRTTSYTSVSHDMDDIIWQLDIAILQSQSNAGTQASRPQAWAKNIISVGGVYHYGNLNEGDDCWCSGASIGPAADGRIKPDVAYWYDRIYTTDNETDTDYYSSFGGTSAATPETAGIVGLIAQMWAENVWGTNPVGSTVFEKAPHASTLKALLINNAKQWPFSGLGDDLGRFKQGWGRGNAQIAYERAATSFVVDHEENLEVGETIIYSIDVPAGQDELRVTMVYPDLPGTTSAQKHRINDLNLRVTSPSLDVYYGNLELNKNMYSIVVDPENENHVTNDVDTVENVLIQSPEAGTWTVRIDAEEINDDAVVSTPEDDATFSLVVTGGVQSGSASSPGEATTLLVSSYDDGTGTMSLSFTAGCGATDHVIEYGTLTQPAIASYGWSGQECGIGNGPLYDWNVSSLPESLFFVVVGRDGAVSGSYGVDGVDVERDEDDTSTACPAPQELTFRCD